MNNRKILIISYYWPPSGGVGVQRWMNYAIQLKKLGWEPIIYTPEDPQFEIRDASLIDRVKAIRVVRTRIWEPFRLFHRITGGKNRGQVQQGLVLEKGKTSWKDRLFIWIRGNLLVPDPRKFWIGPSVRFLVPFLKKEGIQMVITTGPPHSMHLIGMKLKQMTGITWLADFRDPWSKWDVLDKLRVGKRARKRHRQLEEKVLTEADRVLTVSQHLKEGLSALGGGDRVHLLYNGLSSDVSAPRKPAGKLTLGYYGMLNELRNPSVLWEVLNRYAGDREMELRLGGIVSTSIKNEIEGLPNLSSATRFLGYLEHEELKDEYERCDVLILLLNKSDNAKWILPVKFFEYLSASRYLLALGPTASDLNQLAQGLPTFKMVDFDEMHGMEEALRDAWNDKDFSPAHALLERFNHATLAKSLEEVIKGLHGKD